MSRPLCGLGSAYINSNQENCFVYIELAFV
jgi:hypothetical protein